MNTNNFDGKDSGYTEKISVIIPAYKVEKYIEICILSVLNQTYKNLEVIAVDDGSPDNTPAVLDKLSAQYPQLKVIHKANGGVSQARNTGLAAATGDYVVFVDGDDYLAHDYMEYMLGLAKKTGAEFCLSLYSYTKQNEPQTAKETETIISPAQAVALLLSPKVIVGCWNKIFKRSMLEKHNCRFAEDLFYGEGLNFITNAAQVANCVGVGNRKVYYYRKNNDVSATTSFNIEKIYNGEKSIDRIDKNLKIRTPAIETMLILHRSMFFIGAAVRIKAANMTEQYKDYYKKCMAYVRGNYLKLAFKKNVSLYRKLLLLCGCISPWLLAKLDVIRRNRIYKKSV